MGAGRGGGGGGGGKRGREVFIKEGYFFHSLLKVSWTLLENPTETFLSMGFPYSLSHNGYTTVWLKNGKKSWPSPHLLKHKLLYAVALF